MPSAPSVLPQSIVKTLLTSIVSDLRSLPTTLKGDDSPLADAWEEIKEQVQQRFSPYWWPAYLMTINGTIEGVVEGISASTLVALSNELGVPSPDKTKITEALRRRLLAKAKREKVRYTPFHFEYFRYYISGENLPRMCAYAQIIRRTGRFTCWVLAYSAAAPFGEEGEINTDAIESILTAAEFERARHFKWPDQ